MIEQNNRPQPIPDVPVLQAYRVPALRALCAAHGLRKTGTKAVLIERLSAYRNVPAERVQVRQPVRRRARRPARQPEPVQELIVPMELLELIAGEGQAVPNRQPARRPAQRRPRRPARQPAPNRNTIRLPTSRLIDAPVRLDEDGNAETCMICLSEIEHPTYFDCASHIGCRNCITEMIRENRSHACPVRCNE